MPKSTVTVDPVLDAFHRALEALHARSWSQAAELFESVIQQSDTPEIRARPRRPAALAARRERPQAREVVERRHQRDRLPGARRGPPPVPGGLPLARGEG